MIVILVEAVLFILSIATGGALIYYLVVHFTPIGVRVRQTRNRTRIDDVAERTGPIHSQRPALELVRLTSGELGCPDCYKETVQMPQVAGSAMPMLQLPRP